MGAMENPGCVTFRDDYVFTSAVTDAEREARALVIAHEMAHMWFGDLVTMSWWDDLWLNESFAEYLGHRVTAEVTEFTNAWTTFALGTQGLGVRGRPAPVHASGLGRCRRHRRGAAELRRDLVRQGCGGAEATRGAAGRRGLLRRPSGAFRRARVRQRVARRPARALGDASGRDLAEWAHVWLRTVGVSTLRLTTAYDETGTYADVLADAGVAARHAAAPDPDRCLRGRPAARRPGARWSTSISIRAATTVRPRSARSAGGRSRIFCCRTTRI